MRTKHAFKPSSLDRLESREVLSTISPALIPSGSGQNALGGPSGFTGTFNGAGRTFADAGAATPAAAANGFVNSGTGRNTSGGSTGFNGAFNGAGRTFADAGRMGTTTNLNQLGGPTGFNGRFNGFSNTFADPRAGNGLGANGSAFANGSIGAGSGVFSNNRLGSTNTSPFNQFAGQNGFTPSNGLNVNNSNGFATGTVTGPNGRTFLIPHR